MRVRSHRLPFLLPFWLALASCGSAEPTGTAERSPETTSGGAAGSEQDPDSGSQECAPQVRWERTWTASDTLSIHGEMSRVDGSVLLTGTMVGTADFGGGVRGREGVGSGFVVALAADGSYLWDRTWTDSGELPGRPSLKVATDGSVLVAGTLEGTADFGGGPRGRARRRSGYVVALGPDGAYRWDRTWTSEVEDRGIWQTLSLADDGTVLVVGSFRGVVDFGSEKRGHSEKGSGLLLALGLDGSVRWMLTPTASGAEFEFRRRALTVGETIFVQGFFLGTVDLGDGVRGEEGKTSSYVLALGTDGSYRWDRAWTFEDMPSPDVRMLTVAGGGLRMAGTLQGTVDFGGGPRGRRGETSSYVLALGPDGSYQWDHLWAGNRDSDVSGITLLSSGETLVSGHMEGVTDLGGGPRGGPRERLWYLLALGPDGAYRWDRSWRAWGRIFAIAPPTVAPDGTLVLTGNSTGVVDLRNGNPDPPSGSGKGGFVIALGPDGSYRWDRTWPGGSSYHPKIRDDEVLIGGYLHGVVDLGGGPRGQEGSESMLLLAIGLDGSYRWDWTDSTKKVWVGFDVDPVASGPLRLTGTLREPGDSEEEWVKLSGFALELGPPCP